MAIINYDEKEFIKIINNEGSLLSEIQYYIDEDNDNVVTIQGNKVNDLFLQHNNLVQIAFAKKDFKCKLRIEQYASEHEEFDDCIELNVEVLNNLIGMDEGSYFINGVEVEYTTETEDSYRISFYRKD